MQLHALGIKVRSIINVWLATPIPSFNEIARVQRMCFATKLSVILTVTSNNEALF